SPEVERLRPPFPGTGIADARFLADGAVALTVAAPRGAERQLWRVDGRREPRRLGPSDAPAALDASPDGGRVAYLARAQGSGAATGPLVELWIGAAGSPVGERRYALPAGGAGERLVDVSWGPDGRD